jgi:toxin ParE1/3/4
LTLAIRWHRRAQTDLSHIDGHYFAIDPDVANDMARKLVAAARFLAEWPEAGAHIEDGPRRSWTVRKSPYVVIYRAYPDHIRILGVRHGRQDWRTR